MKQNPSDLPLRLPGLRALTGCLLWILLWLVLVAATAAFLVWAWRFIVHG